MGPDTSNSLCCILVDEAMVNVWINCAVRIEATEMFWHDFRASAGALLGEKMGIVSLEIPCELSIWDVSGLNRPHML